MYHIRWKNPSECKGLNTISINTLSISLSTFLSHAITKCESCLILHNYEQMFYLLIYVLFIVWVFYIDRMNCDFFHQPMSFFYFILVFNLEVLSQMPLGLKSSTLPLSLCTPQNHWSKFNIISQKCSSSIIPSTKIAQIIWVH